MDYLTVFHFAENNDVICSDPAYITSFEENDCYIYVLEYTDNLGQYFEKLREVGDTFRTENMEGTLQYLYIGSRIRSGRITSFQTESHAR